MKTKFNKLLIYRVTHIFVILILIVLTVLYVCPIKYVQVWEHPGEYYSVFQIINIEYYWILITSIILNILAIVFSILFIVSKESTKNRLLKVMYYLLIGICLLFVVLTFIFSFVYSNNYPKTF